MTAIVLDITPDEYHARTGFSSTLAKELVARSPAHARALQIAGRKATKVMDIGNVGHRLVLGKGRDFKPLPFDDWRTKAAQAARDEARAAGLVPIKEDDFAQAAVMAESVRVQLLERGITLDGESEIAVEWHEPTEHGPVLCRAMFDYAWIEHGKILDLKFTDNAAQTAIERNAENLGYAIQWAAYTRAMAALRPDLAGRTEFLFAFCERAAPFAINLTKPDGLFRELGERRWLRAVAEWARCLATGEYPAYGRGINVLSAPAWALAKEEEIAA